MNSYFKIKDIETRELYIVQSDEVIENAVLVTEENNCFIKPVANDVENFTTVVEGISQSELIKNKIADIKAKYENHKINGWNAYQDFRAMIVLDIYDGKITEQMAFIIEKDLKLAYDRISQNGDWKTAYYELSNAPVTASFVTPYKTLALNYIANYIQTNYDN